MWFHNESFKPTRNKQCYIPRHSWIYTKPALTSLPPKYYFSRLLSHLAKQHCIGPNHHWTYPTNIQEQVVHSDKTTLTSRSDANRFTYCRSKHSQKAKILVVEYYSIIAMESRSPHHHDLKKWMLWPSRTRFWSFLNYIIPQLIRSYLESF